jgi:hypothetical protein
VGCVALKGSCIHWWPPFACTGISSLIGLAAVHRVAGLEYGARVVGMVDLPQALERLGPGKSLASSCALVWRLAKS